MCLFVFGGIFMSLSKVANPTLEIETNDKAKYIQEAKSQIQDTLALYLNNPSKLSDTLVNGLGDNNSGLINYPSDYYKSKFVVINSKKSLAGGIELNILFVEKPDKVFWVWLYKQADGTYDMRGFQENTIYTEDTIKEIQSTLKQI